jgi:hypothetical protein
MGNGKIIFLFCEGDWGLGIRDWVSIKKLWKRQQSSAKCVAIFPLQQSPVTKQGAPIHRTTNSSDYGGGSSVAA